MWALNDSQMQSSSNAFVGQFNVSCVTHTHAPTHAQARSYVSVITEDIALTYHHL